MIRPEPEQYTGYRVTGTRLKEPVWGEAEYHSSEQELGLVEYFHALDKAHLVMLVEKGFVPLDEGVQMLRAFRDMEEIGLEKIYLEVNGGMHSGEIYMIRRFGEDVGGKLELGRASGEVVQVSWRMRERDLLLRLMRATNRFRGTLQKMAGQHLGTLIPGYTHGQQAQVLTLAHIFLAWDGAMSRSFDRASEALKRVNWSAAGTGNMAGCDFAIDRHKVADLLGFAGPVDNTYDAIQHNDHALECFSVLAILDSFLSRWAQDLYFYMTPEVGMMEIPDRYCGTSALMAQKKNPMLIEFLQGASSLPIGHMVTAFLVEKTPSGGAIAERRFFINGLWDSFEATFKFLYWMDLILPDCQWNVDRMRELSGMHWAQASDLGGVLVKEKGLAWRTAHAIAGTVVRLSLERSIRPRDVTTSLVDEAAELYIGQPLGLSPDLLTSVLDPEACVDRHNIFGGPASNQMSDLLQERRKKLAKDEKASDSSETRVEKARTRLEIAVDALIGGNGDPTNTE
jgi:argininosuccinate lyase